jgi:DNA processing protein
VGIVGTRHPTAEAADFAHALAGTLAEAGVVIASGGAEGIDAKAHEGALAVGGTTVVVAPSSLNKPYPAAHRDLFKRVVDAGGAHASSFETGILARRHQFFERNSILVALCHVLVVVEAPLRSGALNAAKWARQLGRPLFVVPSAPWNPNGAGCIAELERGARPLATHRPVLSALADMGLHAVRQPGEPAAASCQGSMPVGLPRDVVLTAAECRLLAAMRAESAPSHPDVLASRAGLGSAETSHATLLLTLKGLVRQLDDGSLTPAD